MGEWKKQQNTTDLPNLMISKNGSGTKSKLWPTLVVIMTKLDLKKSAPKYPKDWTWEEIQNIIFFW